MNTRRQGFTIIELLIVAGILAMLAGILFPVLEDTLVTTRDSVRANDMKNVQTALENYRKVNGIFPIQTTLAGDWTAGKTYNTGLATDYIPGLVPTYLTTLPKDPDPKYPDAGIPAGYGYVTDATGDNYKFIMLNTPETFPDGNPFHDPVRALTSWSTWTPGGRNF